MNHKIWLFGALAWGLLLAGACDDSEDARPNPSFHGGGKANSGQPAAGETSRSDAGDAAGGSATSQGGAANHAGGVSSEAGSAGAAPEVAPYDCVLHPKTHLEIINACTSADHVEKHPVLPKIP